MAATSVRGLQVQAYSTEPETLDASWCSPPQIWTGHTNDPTARTVKHVIHRLTKLGNSWLDLSDVVDNTHIQFA